MNTKDRLEYAVLDISKYLDKKWTYLAMDSDGEFWLHEEKPELTDGTIGKHWRNFTDMDKLHLKLPYTGTAQDSLVDIKYVTGEFE